MLVTENFKHLGLISILVAWFSMVYLVYKWRGESSMSLSEHAAAHKPAYYWSATTLTLAWLLFYLFTIKWLIPSLGLPSAALYVITLATIGDLTAIWVPEGNDLRGKIHKISAYGMAVLFIPFTMLIFLSPHISPAASLVALASLIYMTLTTGLFIYGFKTQANYLNYYLYFQTSYILVFHLAVLAAVYIR